MATLHCGVPAGTKILLLLEDSAPGACEFRTWSAFPVTGDDERVEHVTVPSPTRVRLRIVGASGEPVPDEALRRVSVTKDHVSRANGGLWLCPPDSSVRIHVQAEGFVRYGKDHATEGPGDSEIRVVLQREYLLRGRLLDATGVPVSGAGVWVIDVHRGRHGRGKSLRDGSFHIRGLPPGIGGLIVARPKGAEMTFPLFRLAPDSTPSGDLGDVVIPPPERLRGHVTDETGAGIPGVHVEYECDPTMKAFRTMTGSRGEFALHVPPVALGVLRVGCEGRASGRWEGTPAQLARVGLFELGPEALVEITWPRCPDRSWVASLLDQDRVLVWAAPAQVTAKRGVQVTAFARGIAPGNYNLRWCSGNAVLFKPVHAVAGVTTRIRAEP